MEKSYSCWVYVRTFHVAIPPRVLLRLMQFRNLITYPKEYEGMAASIQENLNLCGETKTDLGALALFEQFRRRYSGSAF